MTAGVIGDCTYLLPIRSARPPTAELTDYLRSVAEVCPVIVVDGSDPAVFDEAHAVWSPFVTHVAPDPARRCLNGKVRGVLTGLDLITTRKAVVADDDVRYGRGALRHVARALDGAPAVVPQNHFDPLPWHARWDTARTLLNRCVGFDMPGTIGFRVDVLRRVGGYDGDVLFENLEMLRTLELAGGPVRVARDVYVRRLPPTTAHFVGQRVRQAYDEFARPWRMVLFLSIVPALIAARRRPAIVVAAAALSCAAAERGRRRAGGRQHFPATSTMLAPLWLTERAVCAWIAVGWWCRGGVPYAGSRLRRAANSRAALRHSRAG